MDALIEDLIWTKMALGWDQRYNTDRQKASFQKWIKESQDPDTTWHTSGKTVVLTPPNRYWELQWRTKHFEVWGFTQADVIQFMEKHGIRRVQRPKRVRYSGSYYD